MPQGIGVYPSMADSRDERAPIMSQYLVGLLGWDPRHVCCKLPNVLHITQKPSDGPSKIVAEDQPFLIGRADYQSQSPPKDFLSA